MADRWTQQGNAAAWLAELRVMVRSWPTQASDGLPPGLVINVSGTLVAHPDTLAELRRPAIGGTPWERL